MAHLQLEENLSLLPLSARVIWANCHPVLHGGYRRALVPERIVQAVTDSRMRSKAMALGSGIRGEEGVTQAVQLIRDRLCA